MHHLLERQLKKFFGDNPVFPPEQKAFFKTVNDTYTGYDQDRVLLERSFELSSKEFVELNNKVTKLLEELKIEKESVEKKVVERTQELKQKVEELNVSNQLLFKREADLTLANERLLELDKVKSEFISVAAHQLRTPLSAIKWTLSLLIDENSDNLNSEQKSLLLKGYESNERIIALINEMLIVTRIESGKAQYNISSTRMEDLIENVIVDFAGQTHVRNIKFAFDKPATKLPYVNIDPEKIRSVLQNMIENAVKYTKDGGNINIGASLQDDGKIRVTVKDNGIGIPAHQQASVFNKFFRADNAVKVQTDGSGLGLFIAKSIIEKHGGTMWFESTEGVGSTFYFNIPVEYGKTP